MYTVQNKSVTCNSNNNNNNNNTLRFVSFDTDFVIDMNRLTEVYPIRLIRKILKAIISFAVSVCPSMRMEQLDSHWTEFHEI